MSQIFVILGVLAMFFLASHCIGCFLSGRGSNADRGAGFLLVLLIVVPASIGLSTLAYYGVQSAVAIYVASLEGGGDGTSRAAGQLETQPMPDLKGDSQSGSPTKKLNNF